MEKNEQNSNKTKVGLVIDYSKFQNKFINNQQIQKNNNKEKISNIDNNKKIDETSKQKNLDQFLNMSGILNENESQSFLLDNLNQNNVKESSSKIINTSKIPKTDRIIFNNNLEDISLDKNDYQNLLTNNFNNLTLNTDNNKILGNFEKNNNFKTVINSAKKQKYAKFLNTNYGETERKKCVNGNLNNKNLIHKLIIKKGKPKKNNMNSYVEMIKKNNLFDTKNYKRNNNKQNNDSFNLFEDNHKYNNSITNLSGISNIATGDYSNNTSRIINKTNNNTNIKSLLFSNFNKQYNEDLNKKKIHHQKNNSYDKYYNINDLDLLTNKSYNKKIKDKNKNKNKINKSNLLIYNNKDKNKNYLYNYNYNSSLKIIENKATKNNNFDNKDKDDVILLLDDIKNKYKNKENKYINQQKNMKNEIQILREKLKKLSVNEVMYQVEIEKLKRNNNDIKNEQINTNFINNNNINNSQLNINNNPFNDFNKINNSNEINFGQKLDNIIKSNDNQNNNQNNNIGFNNNKLLEIFNLDKNFLVGENLVGSGETIDYKEIFNKYPQLKQFIQILVKKYNNEKEYRIRLEEKTVEIFSNDMKTINTLEKKIKKYEANKHFKVNSSLNISSDGCFSDNNMTKNSCKSYEKIL